ncbi:MAG: SH3 domain-containing protein [Caldilinea sp. CFX5]|nr:SH3 domain-containing protein [Caldilinea sp. CFX5]
MNEIEQNVWRTVRAVTVLAVLVVLLLVAGSVANLFDRSLVGGWGGSTSSPTLQEPTGPGVRVQSYAEIVPGVNNTAHAWALGPDQQGSMSSNSVADEQALSAAAESVWPRATLAMVARSGLAEKPAVVGDLVTPTPAPTAVMLPTIASASPAFLVQQPLANLRGGPGTEYPILGVTHAGNRYPITGRSEEWWQVTVNGGVAWMHSALGVTEGDAVTVSAISTLPAVPTVGLVGGANDTEPTATPTRLPSYGYSVAMERHSEANTLVAYALIQDSQAIVGDLYLLVTHGGQQWRSGPSSYAVSGVTKPADPASPENKTYNAKIDFPRFLHPDLDLTGEWGITLVDGNNTPLSVTTVVQIAPNDPQREIYLHYRKVKL